MIDSLNDYRPVALEPIIIRLFERLVLKHLQASLPSALHQHKIAYCKALGGSSLAVTTRHFNIIKLDIVIFVSCEKSTSTHLHLD